MCKSFTFLCGETWLGTRRKLGQMKSKISSLKPLQFSGKDVSLLVSLVHFGGSMEENSKVG